MSRLQKKKPKSEKKTRRTSPGSESAARSTPEKTQPKAPATAAGKKSPAARKPRDAGPDAGQGNIIQRSVEFLREVKVELKKVTWPTRKQTTGTTIVVIIFVFVVAAFLGLFDLGLSKLVQVILT